MSEYLNSNLVHKFERVHAKGIGNSGIIDLGARGKSQAKLFEAAAAGLAIQFAGVDNSSTPLLDRARDGKIGTDDMLTPEERVHFPAAMEIVALIAGGLSDSFGMR